MTVPNHIVAGHEMETASVRLVSMAAIVLIAVIMIVFISTYGLFRYLAHHAPLVTNANPMAQRVFPPLPRIEEHPSREVEQLRREEDRILSSYGWVDKKGGVVRIPIDRAMELQLKRGFPVRPEGAKR